MADARNYRATIRDDKGKEVVTDITHVNFAGTLEEAKALYLKGHPYHEIVDMNELTPPTEEEVAAIIRSSRQNPGQKTAPVVPPRPSAFKVADQQRQPGAPGEAPGGGGANIP